MYSNSWVCHQGASTSHFRVGACEESAHTSELPEHYLKPYCHRHKCGLVFFKMLNNSGFSQTKLKRANSLHSDNPIENDSSGVQFHVVVRQ